MIPKKRGKKNIQYYFNLYLFEWALCLVVRYVLKPNDDLDTEYITYEVNRWCETLKRNVQNADQRLYDYTRTEQ
jgi:hypothetical protein